MFIKHNYNENERLFYIFVKSIASRVLCRLYCAGTTILLVANQQKIYVKLRFTICCVHLRLQPLTGSSAMHYVWISTSLSMFELVGNIQCFVFSVPALFPEERLLGRNHFPSKLTCIDIRSTNGTGEMRTCLRKS